MARVPTHGPFDYDAYLRNLGRTDPDAVGTPHTRDAVELLRDMTKRAVDAEARLEELERENQYLRRYQADAKRLLSSQSVDTHTLASLRRELAATSAALKEAQVLTARLKEQLLVLKQESAKLLEKNKRQAEMIVEYRKAKKGQ